MNEIIHVFITKYALTLGIQEKDAEVCASISSKMIEVKSGPENHSYGEHYHKPHWHLTREDAVVQAEKMRKNKLASLKKSMDKLTKLQF